MRQLKHICEGLLKGQTSTLANGENDIKAALNIPTLDDFRWNSSGSSVYFPCEDRLKKYNGYRWCPMRASGLQFSVSHNPVLQKCTISISLCNENEKFASYYAPDIKGWSAKYYSDKPLRYCKKVVISLIEHIAKNPKAFDAMINYNAEIYKDIACRQSYDDGRPMKIRGLEELFKIKG